jgi:hypothetical protein
VYRLEALLQERPDLFLDFVFNAAKLFVKRVTQCREEKRLLKYNLEERDAELEAELAEVEKT